MRLVELITGTIHNFEKHEGSSHAAAIAYHATISLGPLLLFSIGLASRAFGREAAVNQVIVGVANVAGRAMADFVSSLNDQLSRPASDNFLLSMVSLGITIFAASNVFRQLVIALNTIWEVSLVQVDIRDGVVRWAFIRLRKYVIGLVVAMVTIVSLLGSMILAIVPIALGLSAGGEFRQPMAIAILGGMVIQRVALVHREMPLKDRDETSHHNLIPAFHST